MIEKLGNFYKISESWLKWLGPDPETYKNATTGGEIVYDQKYGNGDFSDLVKLIEAVNSPPDKFYQNIDKVVNIDLFLRTMVVEVFARNPDGFPRKGRNYGFYHNPKTGLFDWVTYDWEKAFCDGRSCVADGTDSTIGVYETFAKPDDILFKKILVHPPWRKIFTEYFKRYLSQVLESRNAVITLSRMKVLTDFLNPLFKKDGYYNLVGRNESTPIVWYEGNLKWFPARWDYVVSKLEN